MTFKVDIINPKAAKLLQDLADLKLITIQAESEDPFMSVVKRIRKKASEKGNVPTLAEITKEVKLVRKKRYASKKK